MKPLGSKSETKQSQRLRKVAALKEEIKNRYGKQAEADFNKKIDQKNKMKAGISLKFSEIYKQELARAKEKQTNSHRLVLPQKEPEQKIETIRSSGDASTQPVSSRVTNNLISSRVVTTAAAVGAVGALASSDLSPKPPSTTSQLKQFKIEVD